ncbi:MAG: hypothetical protein RL293_1789 [Bacteroidota bacterium]
MIDVIENLFGMKPHQLNAVLFSLITNIVIALIITIAGFWLTGVLTRFITRMLKKSDTDAGLVSFLGSFLSMALKIMVVVSAWYGHLWNFIQFRWRNYDSGT